MELADLNYFIFRLKHLKGLGNQGLLKIISHALVRDWQSLTLSELIQLGKVKKNYQDAFAKSYEQTREHEDMLRRVYEARGFLTILDNEYPAILKEIYNPPAALFYQGDLALLSKPSLAIIGSRQSSQYGEKVVAKLLGDLVPQLVTISGLARGIDTLVHQQTIRYHGETIGVIGCGLDVIYPKENSRIQAYLAEHHLVVSEYTYGQAPLAFHFPARNRIIAGLSLGTLIIEAKEKSGSLITAQLALESGREVFAVPGSILEERALGCHQLIQQGAKCVTTSGDILEELLI